MGQAASGLAIVAGGVQHLANFLKDSPVLATGGGLAAGGLALGGAGYLSYQFMNGFGLGTSAAALDGSAVALDASAAALTAAAGKDVAGGLVQAVEGGLARNSAAVVGAAEGAFAKEAGSAFRNLSLTSVAMTVGSLSIAGVAAVAVIDALSAGPRKKLAADDPNFGNPFAAGNGPKLSLDALPFPGMSGPASANNARPSNASGPGHWTYGRGGFRQWVPEKGGDVGNSPAPLRNAPFFTNGAFGPDGALSPSASGVFDSIGQMQGKGNDRRAVVVSWGSIAPGGPKWSQMPNFGPTPSFLNPDVGGPLDIRPSIQRAGATNYPPITLAGGGVAGPIDVTGKVQSDVNAHVDTTVKVEISAPAGITARQTFQSTATKVSTGPSMPNAGAAPHVARRDE